VIGADEVGLAGAPESSQLHFWSVVMMASIRASGTWSATTPSRRPSAKIGAATKAAGAPRIGAYDSKSTSWAKSASTDARAARKARLSRVSR
jgi:hypothetical protein